MVVFVLLFFLLVFAETYDYFLKQELKKEGPEYIKKLNICLELLKKYTSDDISHTDCKAVLDKYSEILKRAEKNYTLHREEILRKIENTYEKLVKESEKVKADFKAYGIVIQEDYKYLFINVKINPQKYVIDSVLLNGLPPKTLARCSYDKDYWIFIPIKDGKYFELIIYLIDIKEYEKSVRNIHQGNLLKSMPQKLFRIEIKFAIHKFETLKVKAKKEKNIFIYSLNYPLPKAYASFDFIGLEKEFPRKSPIGCVEREIKLEAVPDGIYIVLPYYNGNSVEDKTFRVDSQ